MDMAGWQQWEQRTEKTQRYNWSYQLSLAGQAHYTSTLIRQMNMTTLTGHTAHDNTNWAHCTCQHQGTLHMSTTPGHTAHVNTTRAHCTWQH